MNLLLVEDEAQKLDELNRLCLSFPRARTVSVRSVRSALDYFREGGLVDLMILDMSLPTFDIDETESGGTPRPFGGIDVMRNLSRLDLQVATVVFTGYQSFEDDSGVITIDILEDKMREEFGAFLIEVVQYTPFSDDWMNRLKNIYMRMESKS